MEKKKLLLVAVSVGVFLVIVISAAFLVFSPRNVSPPPSVAEDSGRSATLDLGDITGGAGLNQLRDPALPSPIQENTISINREPESRVSPGRAAGTGSTPTVISVPKPAAAAVPDLPPKEPVRASESRQPAAAVSRPQPVSKAPPAPKAEAVQPAAKKPAPAPTGKSSNDFWVQAGSFSTRDGADKVKENLDEKGITALIMNQDINGQTYYRVRVGPYTSKNEADYWLVMIKSIDGFEGSQVWESRPQR
ncbi:MAG: SPOR domain-containing protein [Treponema sp.]|jgi:DedD protein|nr:SPOR domain-containing protein [Treponema sp.]